MRKLLLYGLALIFALSLGACQEEEGSTFDFNLDPSVQATFASKELTLTPITSESGNKISIPLYRGNVANAASVPVEIAGGEGIFTPSGSSYDFAAGENVAYIEFSFDYNTIDPLTNIEIAITNEGDVAKNGYGSTTLTVEKQLTYKSIGEGSYYSLFIDTYYGQAEMPQEILKAEEGNYFQVVAPYVDGYNFIFEFDGENVNWLSDGNPSTGLPLAPLGVDGTLHLLIKDIQVTSTAPYTIELTVQYNNEESIFNPNPGKEIIVFPAEFGF